MALDHGASLEDSGRNSGFVAKILTFTAQMWVYRGEGGWHFLSLPKQAADQIRAGARKSSWGSVRVAATIGATTWNTSIFPDSKTRTYLLPVKAEVRRKEGIAAGQTLRCRLAIPP